MGIQVFPDPAGVLVPGSVRLEIVVVNSDYPGFFQQGKHSECLFRNGVANYWVVSKRTVQRLGNRIRHDFHFQHLDLRLCTHLPYDLPYYGRSTVNFDLQDGD